jgi:hypothetical protein
MDVNHFIKVMGRGNPPSHCRLSGVFFHPLYHALNKSIVSMTELIDEEECDEVLDGVGNFKADEVEEEEDCESVGGE